MRKSFFTLMCLVAMMAAGMSLKAQEVTITLGPGWTWISNPSTDTVSFATALGSFTPADGDVIMSQWGASTYRGGQWRGGVSQFYPGYGYHYKSTRTEPVTVTFNEPQPAQQFVVTVSANPAEGGEVSGGGSYQEGAECTLTAIAYSDYNFSYWTENGIIVSASMTYTFTVNANRTLVANFTFKEHAYVDLGLPSGLLWATCNVGADNPEDYGDYFAWGETQPKDYYDWSTYQYTNGTSWSDPQLTKYCDNSSYGYNGFTDNLTTLLPEDDAATANWGSGWRMPTQTEFQELLDNTTVTWTTQNGINGRLFTAANGNSLFLPAADYRYDSGLYSPGNYGYYWSSSLYTGCPYGAWLFYFGFDDGSMFYFYRDYGQSVRPVRSSGQNNAPTGAIDGKFTINANGDQVYFSQGNLQYQASTNTWKFADNQYDYIGSDNCNISSTYSGWIDLFGWGTSGYDHGANAYQPWSTSQGHSDYYAYGSATYNLYDQTGQADWGYNAISNGGNATNQWRTLTGGSGGEWDYVFNTRSTTSGIRYAKAQVNNVNGVILLPDDWSASYYSLSDTNNGGAGFGSNLISASNWTNSLQSHGAVFLPAAGYRCGTWVNGGNGCYWSASYKHSLSAYGAGFSDSGLGTAASEYVDRCDGQSVRLVAPAEN